MAEDLSSQSDELECLRAMFSPDLDPLSSVESNWAAGEEARDGGEPLWCAVTFPFEGLPDATARLVATCPLDYPSVARPAFALEVVNLSAARARDFTARLEETFASEWTAGEPGICQAVEIAKSLLEGEDWTATAPVSAGSSCKSSGWRVLTFNHLLQGDSHKKEKELVQTSKKSGLRGFIAYGTPGVMVVFGEGAALDDFQQGTRSIGKPCKEVHRFAAEDIPGSLEVPAKGVADLEFHKVQSICQEHLQLKQGILES